MISRFPLVVMLTAIACFAGCSRDVLAVEQADGLAFRIAVDPELEHAGFIEQLAAAGPDSETESEYGWFRVQDLHRFVDDDRQIQQVEMWVAMSSNSADSVATMGREMALQFFAQARGIVACPYAGKLYVLLHNKTGLMMLRGEGWDLRYARQDMDALGRPAIFLMLDQPGAALMEAMTEPNVNKPMAVLMDDAVLTTPTIMSRLSDSITITGEYSPEDIEALIARLQEE